MQQSNIIITSVLKMQCLKSEENEDQRSLYNKKSLSRSRTIVKGAANLIKKSSDVTVLAGFLMMILGLALIVLATAAVFAGPRNDKVCARQRISYGHNIGKPLGVYFIKHENRTWTKKELCNIESTARLYPQFNVFTMNLYDDSKDLTRCEIWKTPKDILLLKDHEMSLRYGILGIPNVRNIDIGIDNFFVGSPIAKKVKDMRSEDVEMVAKFQAIWDSPGISLEPRSVHELENFQYYFNGQRDTIASLQIENDIQATSVACQSFVGLVINEMAKNDFPDRRALLTRALADFCPSYMEECQGVRIIRSTSKKVVDSGACPTIYPLPQKDNEKIL